MKEIFEKIKERLEKERHPELFGGWETIRIERAIEIVNQVAEEYKSTMSQVNDEDITLPKIAFDRMISRMESESERDIYEEESLFINVKDAARIVREIAGEYSSSEKPNKSDVWIPVSSGKLPDTNEAVNITWVNRKPPSYYADIKDKPFTATGHYHNGRWYWYSCVCKDYLDEYGDSIGDRMDGNIEVIAWQPLTAPYQPEGE